MSNWTGWNSSASLPPDVNNGSWSVGLVWTFRVLAVIIVALRLYTRTIAKNTAGWDDFCIAISALLTIFGGVNDSLRLAHGWGRHIEYLSPNDIEFVNKWMFIGEENNFISVFFVRLSICLFTLRLLPITQRWPRWFTFGAIALNAVSTIVNLVVFATRCIPTEAIWDMSVHGKCMTMQQVGKAFWAASACGVVIDFVVIIVPCFVIRNLQMNKRTKIGIVVIMCLSILIAMCSIGKMLTISHIRDPIYDTVAVYLFSMFEEECGIIVASMPAMRQLYKHIMSKRDGRHRISEPLSFSDRDHLYGNSPSRNEKRAKSLEVELNEIDSLDV